jgi:hypothetical protein
MLVGFGHRRYVGKDSVCNFAISHIRQIQRNKLVIKTGFSSKLKAVAHDLWGWAGLRDEDYYEDHPMEKDTIIPVLGKSAREIWIELGTTVGRAIYPDTWLDFVLHKKCDHLFIKDVRFVNEADGILKMGGKIYRVDNPQIEKCGDVADTGLEGYDRWTGVIVNDGDLSSLNKKAIVLMESLL